MCVWGASRRSACEESVHELIQQPARPHHFCVSRSYPIGESPVRRDHDRATMRLGDGNDRVVTLAPCVHNLNAIHVALVDARPGSALEYECHRRVEPSRGHGRPHSFSKASCRAGPITPPAGWPRPDHVGGINHEHPKSVAPSRLAGSPALSTKRRIRAYHRPSGLPGCLLGSSAVLLALFCGICVSDYDAAAEWYVRLLGAEPSFIPNDIEAVWDLADDRSIYIVVRPEGAGHSVVAIFVDDLDERVAGIAERGIEPTRQETYDNGVRKVVYRDPDGNEVGFGAAVSVS